MEELTLDYIKNLLNSPKPSNSPLENFDCETEAEHLFSLIQQCPRLTEYHFKEFISAGGSGMVFRVQQSPNDGFYSAMKIIRKKVFDNNDQMPFSNEELDALKELSHPNIVRFIEAIKIKDKVVAVCTSYIENSQGIKQYIQDILNTPPNPEMYKDTFAQVSIERLETTCDKVAVWILEIAKAIAYMHSRGYYHLDIKPTNILMQGSGNNVHAILSDMGSCVKKAEFLKDRVHFTWAYAHPDLTDIATGAPSSLQNGAVRASAQVSNTNKLPLYDLYAFGKTIQEILAVIDNHFGEVCYSNYTFRYLHIISTLLLDGKLRYQGDDNTKKVYEQNGVSFVVSRPMNLSSSLLSAKKIQTADELVVRLKRLDKSYSIIELAPEFSPRCPNVINNTIGELVPFTKRVSAVFNHPVMKRLYNEPQLGLMTEIYPGASHNRWSHSLGVFALLVKYYIALLSDPENPFMRITVDKDDINHGLLAAILHDVGQTSMCHDLEAANRMIFDHLSFTRMLLEGKEISHDKSLIDVIKEYWGSSIDLNRIIGILKHNSAYAVDYVVSDCIDGALDVDKLDYIKRDSYYCGVSYGNGLDYSRIMNSLTVSDKGGKLRLAYYSKGRTAIASMLLARYQLYGSVYWHHTYRCLHAMLFYATQSIFGNNDRVIAVSINKSAAINLNDVRNLYYYRVLCKLPWDVCWNKIGQRYSSITERLRVKDHMFTNDYCIDFIYTFATEKCRELLRQLVNRTVFKRIYTKNLKGIELSELVNKCKDRIDISEKIKKRLFEEIEASRYTTMESAAEKRIEQDVMSLKKSLSNKIAILVDFPQQIRVPDRSWPVEIGDSARKLQNFNVEDRNDIINASNSLLKEIASIRIYAEPNLYRLITRYLTSEIISICVDDVISL